MEHNIKLNRRTKKPM